MNRMRKFVRRSKKIRIPISRCSSKTKPSATTLLNIPKCPNYSLTSTMLLSCRAWSRNQAKIIHKNHCLSYPKINPLPSYLRSLTSTTRAKYKTKRYTICLRSTSTQRKIVLQSNKRYPIGQVATRATACLSTRHQGHLILM